MRRLVSTLALLVFWTVAAQSICLDGILDVGEQCDDGNHYNRDGCNTSCELENEIVWLCQDVPGMSTYCCPKRENPTTHEKVCDCASAEQPPVSDGYTITSACIERDIDECNTNNGDCVLGAICTNNNVVTSGSDITHTCECPPDMIGDGVTLCIIDPMAFEP
jgi:cysteine-rich repeat protein